MCFAATPSRPNAAPPPAPPPVPTKQDPKVQQNIARDRQVAGLAQGRNSTILTSGLGLNTAPAFSAKKKALGA